MNNVTFGAYFNTNSWLHRADARCKILSLILLMVGIFFIDNLYILTIVLALLLILISTIKVPLKEFLKSIKLLTTVLLFTTIFQLLFNHTGEVIDKVTFNINVLSIVSMVLILLLYEIYIKVIKRAKLFALFIAIVLMFLSQVFITNNTFYSYNFYDGAIYTSVKVFLRIICLCNISSLLTFTTKPTDLALAIEHLLKPLKLLRVNVSVFAMLMSISLRFVPTLIREAQKILKSQASRGVEFSEGNLSTKIKQIVSLIVPMFMVSYKKADDLATAMEAKGYNPSSSRTSLTVMKYRFSDYLIYLFVLILTGSMIVSGVLL